MRDAIKRGWALKPADAIHLATAKRIEVSYFHTYDIDKLAKFAELTKLAIEAPKTNRFAFPPKKDNE
jgi:predicted nucleic acid-binding protein